MAEKRENRPAVEGSEIVKVTPTESPSENFLVTEHLQRMPNIFSRGLIYLVVLAVFTALLYSLLAKIDRVVKTDAIARPTSHIIRVVSDRDGYIEKIFISEGETVEQNAPLFLIRSKEALTLRFKIEELQHSIPLKREYYDTEISSLQDELDQLSSNLENFIKVKGLKLQQNDLTLKTIASDLKFWESEVELYAKDFEIIERLYKKKVVAVRDYNYTKSGLEKARTEVEKLLTNRKILLKENKIIEEEMLREKENYNNKNAILKKRIRNLELEKETTLSGMITELERNKKMLSLQDGSYSGIDDEEEKMVKAENAGTISELYFRHTGDYVREADLLCTLVPSGAPLYMDITVANKDIGFIEENMKIKYKFEAFPYTDYGTLMGKAIAISPSAVEDKRLGMVYHVRGSLDKTYYEIKGKNYPIKAGMTATAELVTEKKSIFSILFRKLKE